MTMKALQIYDEGVRVATISKVNDKVFIFARTAREWSDFKRLTSSFDPKQKSFLQNVALMFQSHNFTTNFKK